MKKEVTNLVNWYKAYGSTACIYRCVCGAKFGERDELQVTIDGDDEVVECPNCGAKFMARTVIYRVKRGKGQIL